MDERRNPRPTGTTRAVSLAILSTVAACALFVLAYDRMRGGPPRGDRCPCVEAEGLEDASALARRESLARSLTALAVEKTKRGSVEIEPGPSRAVAPANPPSEGSDELEVSKEERLAKQKADAYALDTQLGSEEVDTRWGAKVERQLTEVFARLGPKLHLDDLTCRETLCRARITHLDPNARDDEVERILSLGIFPGQATAYGSPEDPRSTVLYFSRRGTTLSVLQPPVHMALPPSALLQEQPAGAGP